MFYERLLENWKNEHTHCTEDINNYQYIKEFQDIINEGITIVPLLLNELRWNFDHDFIIMLQIITGMNPDIYKTKEKWIKWGNLFFPFRKNQCITCAWYNPLSPLNSEYICAICKRQSKYIKLKIQEKLKQRDN